MLNKYWKRILFTALIVITLLGIGVQFNVAQDENNTPRVVLTIGEPVNAAGIVPDYVGTTSAVVQEALNALPGGGGELDLISPTYTFSATVSRAINNVTIKGNNGTTINYDGVTPVFSAGAQTGWVFRDLKTDAGGITQAADTVLQNVTLGATYYSLKTATSIQANLVGNVTGNLNGNVTGDVSGNAGTLDTYNASDLVGSISHSAWVIGNDATADIKALATIQQTLGYPVWVCDGTADNVQIQAAIDSVSGTKWESIKLLGSFVIAAKVNLESYLYLDLNDASISLVDAGNVTMMGATSKSNIIISGGVIDGNKANVTGNYDILDLTTSSAIKVIGTEIKNSARKGIAGFKTSDVLLQRIYVHDNGENGTASGYGCTFNQSATDIRVYESRFIDNANNGLWITNNGGAGFEVARVIISGCTAIGNGIANSDGSGLYVHENGAGLTATDVTTVNCVSNGNYNDGVLYIRVNDGSIVGNVCNDSTNGDGIVIDTCDSVEVTGNSCNDNGARGIYSLDTDGIAGINQITGNIAVGNSIANFTIDVDTLPYTRNNGMYIASGETRTAYGTLTAGNANAIALAWHNPHAQDIYIKKVVVVVGTAGGTVGSHLDTGIADDATGTNRGAEFFDDLLLNTAQVDDSWVAGDGGTQTKWILCQDSASATDGWIVGQILDADAASLVGTYYIEYVGK